VLWDLFEASEDLASSYRLVSKESNTLARAMKPTKVVKAVLPAPLGPRSRKLLDGGDATAWKKNMCSAIGTPKVKRTAIAIATRLPSNSNVAMPVTEFQFA
jgi:hypothetical protein